MASNPFFNKFFPRVFYSLTFGPWGDIFLSLFSNQRKTGSVPCSAAMHFLASLSLVSAAVWLRGRRVRGWVDVWVCVEGRGRIHMNERTKFHINQQQITSNRRIKALSALKDGFFMPYELWKMAFGSSRRRLPPRDSVTVAQEVQRLLASSSLSLAADANNEQTEIKLNIWPTL